MSFYLHFYLLVICTSLLWFSDSPVTLARQSTAKITHKLRERLLFEHNTKSILRHSYITEPICQRHSLQYTHHLNKVDEQQDTDLFRSTKLKGNSLLAQTSPSYIYPSIVEPTRPVPPLLPQAVPTPTPVPLLNPQQPLPFESPPAIQTKIKVKRIEVLGSTVFSEQELGKVLLPFKDKPLTFEQLIRISTAVTALYANKGYTTSATFLPSGQNISSGVVQVQVVEGELEKVEIQGLKRLRESYVRSRIKKAATTPINLNRLLEALQLLQLDPLFSRVQAELITGSAPGRSVLLLNLKEALPIKSALIIDNQMPSSVGSAGATAALSHNNLLGIGDRLSVQYGKTEGVDSYGLEYTIPLNAHDGTLSFRYDNGRNTVVEQDFAAVGIRGCAQTYSLSFRQPIIRTPNTEFALSLTGDLRPSQTFIFDNEPYSFTIGPENGESRLSVIRFTQDWVDRNRPKRVLAARSRFSVGVSAFDATVNNTGTDGRFFSWLGQFQWIQALNEERDATLIANFTTQLTDDSLLPIEQFSIGGFGTVRGYPTNQRVADNGIVSSLEVRLPIVRDPDFGLVQLAPFFDIGTVWNNGNDASVSPSTLAGIGLGLRWQLGSQFTARLDWGIPLINIDHQGDSLQDSGIYFSINLKPF